MPDAFEELLNQTFDEAEARQETPEPPAEGPEPEVDEEEVDEPDEEPDSEDGEDEVEDDEPEPEDDGEDGDEEEEGEDDTEDGDPLAVTDDTVLTLPDGSTTTVKDALLRQADYTRKTQELAEQRKEVDDLYSRMETWYSERATNPVGWLEEITTSTQDPTATVAQAIVNLAKAGKLDPEFVKTFGLESGQIADQAHTSQVGERVDQLEQRIEQERTQAQQEQARQQAVREYQRQYREILDSEGLQFDNLEAENAFKVELAEFARTNQITDLRVAHDALARQKDRQRQTAEQKEAAKKAKAEVAKRKKKSAAVTPKGSTGTKASRASSFEESAAEAVEKLMQDGRIAS